ncbi:TolC family protein [Tundrisphaera sp. TA3]|uniref:TolC family protein n=1 Tax=Tundrisphaera sp. TA3 TaxID=3435775 RepID=UPI003EC1281A
MRRRITPSFIAAWLAAWPLASADEGRAPELAPPSASADAALLSPPPSVLPGEFRPIDLGTALRLAGAENPELNLARQRVVEAAALRMYAAAQILPTINAGVNYDAHNGNLQQSNGNMLSVSRSAVYVGAGSNAVGAGTVNIPGVVLSGNIGQGIFAYLTSRQVVIQREAATLATRNQVFLRVTLAYSELTRAEGRRAIALQARDEAREVARLTAEYAATGEGRKADADRAATELARREGDVLTAEGDILAASAALCRAINLDPSIRLHPTDAFVVPMPIVPDPQPLCELIALGLLRRPELAERRAVIREALLSLQGSKVLPFSPTVLVGFSAGGFGGGSNLVRPVFGSLAGRSDFDVVAYWTIQNLGVGNVALIRTADARLKATKFQEIAVLNQVRAEVATAYARTHARFARIATTEAATRSSQAGFREDYDLIRSRGTRSVLPIELLNNFRLLNESRREYLDAIVDYNRAQFELYVALGQPPADSLARPAPIDGIAPSDIPGTIGGPAAGAPAAPAPAAMPNPG